MLLNFVLDLETQRRDFRQIRLKLLLIHLVGLLELLERVAIEEHLVEARKDGGSFNLHEPPSVVVIKSGQLDRHLGALKLKCLSI